MSEGRSETTGGAGLRVQRLRDARGAGHRGAGLRGAEGAESVG